jgi:hypothetical protein
MKPFRECKEIQFLRGKIFLDDFSHKLEETKIVEIVSFALLGLATGFDSFPKYVDVEELVSSHMMTLLRYDEQSEEVFGVFPPEGVLNGVASFFLTNYISEALNPLKKMVASCIIDVGVLGETVAKINLIHASFSVNSVSSSFLGQPVRKQICGCIFFEDFLSKYTGDDSVVKLYIESNKQLKNSKRLFLHSILSRRYLRSS